MDSNGVTKRELKKIACRAIQEAFENLRNGFQVGVEVKIDGDNDKIYSYLEDFVYWLNEKDTNKDYNVDVENLGDNVYEFNVYENPLMQPNYEYSSDDADEDEDDEIIATKVEYSEESDSE